MGFPTISRGFGVRDDYLDASLTTLNSASVSTDTFTSDGDIVTWNVTMTNPSNGDVAILYRPVVSGPDPSVYPASIVRANVTTWANATNFQLRPWVAYTPSGTTDTGQNSLINTTSPNKFRANEREATHKQHDQPDRIRNSVHHRRRGNVQLHCPAGLHLHLQRTPNLSIGQTTDLSKKTPQHHRDSNSSKRRRCTARPRVHVLGHNRRRTPYLDNHRRWELDQHIHGGSVVVHFQRPDTRERNHYFRWQSQMAVVPE